MNSTAVLDELNNSVLRTVRQDHSHHTHGLIPMVKAWVQSAGVPRPVIYLKFDKSGSEMLAVLKMAYRENSVKKSSDFE